MARGSKLQDGEGCGNRGAAGDLNRSDCAGAWKRRDTSEGAIKIFKLKGPKTVLIATKQSYKMSFSSNFQTAPHSNQNMLFTM